MRRYNDRLEIRLSTEQKEQLSQIAGKQTISELIRKTLLFEPTRSEKKINREISNELKRMGNNRASNCQSFKLNPSLSNPYSCH